MKLLVLRPLHPDQPLRMFTEDGREFDGLVSAKVEWGYEGFSAAFSQEIRRAVQLHPPVPTGVTIVLNHPEVAFITEPPQPPRATKT